MTKAARYGVRTRLDAARDVRDLNPMRAECFQPLSHSSCLLASAWKICEMTSSLATWITPGIGDSRFSFSMIPLPDLNSRRTTFS
jgi:hypothetical protein